MLTALARRYMLPVLPVILLLPLHAAFASSAGGGGDDRLRQGFVGPYHASNRSISDGHNTSMWDAFAFGIVAPENSASDGGFLLQDDLRFHCDTVGVNALYGMLVGPTEGGVFNNPNDTSLWEPLAPASPRGGPGMIQGAHRWSELSKSCPQVAGIVLDDFWTNYAGDCAPCPAGTYGYGNIDGGYYCCDWPTVGGRCEKPSAHERANDAFAATTHTGSTNKDSVELDCCLVPGTLKGCQGHARCGTNPRNHSACGSTSATLTLADMLDVKAALQGKTVNPVTGKVDHNSPPTTPHLHLFVVWYTHQTAGIKDDGLISNGTVDGVSLWVEGPSQNTLHGNWTMLVAECRAKLNSWDVPMIPIMGGAYVSHSHTGWLPPAPFRDMFLQSVDMYEVGAMQGFFIFAGTLLPEMNATLWAEWDLPGLMRQNYQPWLGTAHVQVIDSTSGNPVIGAICSVKYGTVTHVTRKNTDATGRVVFDGWSGKSAGRPHMVSVSHPSYQSAMATLQLIAGSVVNMTLRLNVTQYN